MENEEAKFILLYNITPDEYYKREVEMFNNMCNSKIISSNSEARSYIYDRFKKALLKIEEI